MLEEILSWLPVKSLARFKCVKNSWSTATFFQNPSFIAKHQRHRSQTNPDLVVVNLDSEPWVWALSAYPHPENVDSHQGVRMQCGHAGDYGCGPCG